MNVQEEVFRQDLVRFSHLLSRRGFTPGTSGNLSIRLDSARILITPTGVSKGMLAAADMVIVDFQGRQIAGTRRVTSELDMHLAVYEKRSDIGAVIHSHPPICTAFACSARGLEEIHCQEATMTAGKVPLACYATTGTKEVAASLQPYLRDHDAILLANHGLITYGANLSDAFMKTETVEHLAQVTSAIHRLGTRAVSSRTTI